MRSNFTAQSASHCLQLHYGVTSLQRNFTEVRYAHSRQRSARLVCRRQLHLSMAQHHSRSDFICPQDNFICKATSPKIVKFLQSKSEVLFHKVKLFHNGTNLRFSEFVLLCSKKKEAVKFDRFFFSLLIIKAT